MISRSPQMVACLGKDCKKTFHCDEKFLNPDRSLPEKNVFCRCFTLMCVGCKLEGHEPVSCKAKQNWNKFVDDYKAKKGKFALSLETIKWIRSNTKKCPECNVNIQKNQGCMHMTCRHCRHEFCWLCKGPWSKHGSQTGGYYECNLYDPKKNYEDHEELDEEMFKIVFYVKRYVNHMDSVEGMHDELVKMYLSFLPLEKSPFYEYNTKVEKNGLYFYLETYAICMKIRNFIAHTYILASKIKDDTKSKLFSQNQYFLEYACEEVHKALLDFDIKKKVRYEDGKLVFSKDLLKKEKEKIMEMRRIIVLHFESAKRDMNNRNLWAEIDFEFEVE